MKKKNIMDLILSKYFQLVIDDLHVRLFNYDSTLYLIQHYKIEKFILIISKNKILICIPIICCIQQF